MTDPTPILIATDAQLRSVIERIERLEEEKAEVADQIKEVYAEAKGNGFDPAILRKVVALRKQDAETRERTAALLETYLSALGLRAGGA
jgi:uncharacterized protein (UPF0335 family)